MIWKSMVFMGLLTGPVVAQGLAQVDPYVVEGCFAATPTGDAAPACLGQAANTCQGSDGSTIGIAQCIQAETQVWDGILNREYKAVRGIFGTRDAVAPAGSVVLKDQLLTAQRAWIAYRDAECTLSYARWQEGSIRSIVHANCVMVMTARRALELRDMKGN